MLAGKLWAVCGFLLIPGLLLAEEDVSGKEPPNIQVNISGDQQEVIELEVRKARLGQVIDEIARKTGIRAHHSVLPEEWVTATCAGETLKQVMECLLGPNADLIFRYPSGLAKTDSQGRPEELWVLGSSLAGRASSADPRDSGHCTETGVRQDATSRGKLKTAKREQAETEKLVVMATAEDPGQRADAISRLSIAGRGDDGSVRKALEAALSDSDASVRAQAISSLALRKGAEAAAALQEALHDSDASVRLMAVDRAGTDARGVALLQEALADSDETVRVLAARKLGQISGSMQ